MATSTVDNVKSKRIKRVFSSHSQLAHVWAQQVQDYGRGNSMFFCYTTDIYSYGHHYLAARMHTNIDGRRFALVRSDTYSVSTSKHLNEIHRACRGLVPVFAVAGNAILDPELASGDLDAQVMERIMDALNRKFFADSWKTPEQETRWALDCIQDALDDANTLRIILGMPPLVVPEELMQDVRDHFEKLTRAFNSPEREAKRAANQKRAEEKFAAETERLRLQRIEEEKDQAQRIEDFRAGNRFGWIHGEYQLIRIKGERVETSDGAEVPLKKALSLMNAIDHGARDQLVGNAVGHFTVDFFGGEGETEFVSIGCHRILLSEAREVLRGRY